MTNEELAVAIQAGEREKLPELWQQVEKFVAMQARRRLVLSAGLGGVEFEDLYQSGYLALVAAADTYDPAAGLDFQNAEDWLYQEQLHEALEKAMDQLPDRQGRTLRQRFYQHRSLEEIAADEGVSKEAIRLWQTKELQALRQQKELQRFVEDRTPTICG